MAMGKDTPMEDKAMGKVALMLADEAMGKVKL